MINNTAYIKFGPTHSSPTDLRYYISIMLAILPLKPQHCIYITHNNLAVDYHAKRTLQDNLLKKYDMIMFRKAEVIYVTCKHRTATIKLYPKRRRLKKFDCSINSFENVLLTIEYILAFWDKTIRSEYRNCFTVQKLSPPAPNSHDPKTESTRTEVLA